MDWISVLGLVLEIAGVAIISEPLWWKFARTGDPQKARIVVGGKRISLDFYESVKRRAPLAIPITILGLVLQVVGIIAQR